MGPSIFRYDGMTGFFMFMDIKPVGFKFNSHSSIAAGYRFIKCYEAKNHAFTIQYRYNF